MYPYMVLTMLELVDKETLADMRYWVSRRTWVLVNAYTANLLLPEQCKFPVWSLNQVLHPEAQELKVQH